jgi:VWFA-related protein
MRPTFTASFILFLVSYCAAPLCAQTASSDQTAIPSIKAESKAVIVDVVVTKSNGEHVLGLKKQDFKLTEDGKLQTVDFFEEHTAKALPPGALPELPPMPPNTYTNVPPAPASDSVNVLLLDSLNTPQQDQAYVHRQITDFLAKLQPGTRVAIFSLGSKLRFVQGFTADTSVLIAALKDRRNGAAPTKEVGVRDATDSADDAADLGRLRMMQYQGIDALMRAQSEERETNSGARASMTFEALDYLARYLAGVPGRKNLIWFSSTFPIIIFPTTAQRAVLEDSPRMPGYFKQIKKTADLLTVAKVAVYPVGAEGVMVEHVMDADAPAAGGQWSTGHQGAQSDVIGPFTAGAGERADKIGAMEQLAASTGGKAIFNTNDLNDAMRRAIDDGSSYYTISYSPTNKKADGSYRQIEVQLPGSHYKLAYRHGYNAEDAPMIDAKSEIDPLQPLLKLGLPSATGLLYAVHVEPSASQPAQDSTRAGQNPNLKAPLTRYKVNFFIRWTDVAFQSTPQGRHSGKIQVALMAYDRDGKAVNWDASSEEINLKPEAYAAIQKSGIPAEMEIDLPNRDLDLVTGVYDWGNGKAGTLDIPLHPSTAIAKPSPAQPKAEPPRSKDAPSGSSMALPATTFRHGTIQELRQILAAQQSTKKSDGAMAEKIASLELTEQLTQPTLDQITSEIKPGPKTARVLDLLADSSALLPPPANEILAVPKPDMATQRSIFETAINYVAKTMPHLPDFIATRETQSFDDSPMVVSHTGFAPHTDMHQVGTFSRTITYRDGREVLDAADPAAVGKPKHVAGPAGLATWGEFGPVLSIVLLDATKGKVTWSRWEETSAGKVAVFHYEVPKTISHYAEDFCCAWKDLDQANTDKQLAYHGTPAYHGNFYLDPATGAILRITLNTELNETDPITRAEVSVQYGNVDIGGNSYLCPVRSVAVSADRNRPGSANPGSYQLVTRINEVNFKDYHRFGSTSRILPDAQPQ